jgi:hypothetical protein
MGRIPQKGDGVWIESSTYTGDAVVIYVDKQALYLDHLYPIQVKIPESNIDQFEDFNHGQTTHRFSLKEVIVTSPAQENNDFEQESFFDDF